MIIVLDTRINIFFKIYLFSCIFIYSQNSYAQNWPSLFSNDDIISQNKETNSDIIATMPEEKVREKVFNSYYFIADFFSSTKGEEPKGWFDSNKNPKNSLITGFPPDLKRPSLDIKFPLYNLTTINYFISDDPYISRLNTCQSFWIENRLQNAYDCFYFLQIDLTKAGIKQSSAIRLQINIVNAFFLLYLATNEIKDIHDWNLSVVPMGHVPISDNDFYLMSRIIFSFIATKTDDSIFLPKNKQNVIDSIYKNIFVSPVYFEISKKISKNKTKVSLMNNPVDGIKWIQTVMPIVYANAMTMNQAVLLWDRAFLAASKVESYFQHFNYPDMPNVSPLNVQSPVETNSKIFISPKNNSDFLASIDLFRASAMILNKDPAMALEYISTGIYRKADPEMTSLLFDLSGNAYFDLELLRFAKRSYSWAELYSKSFAKKVPSSLLFGAESAYWMGEYDIAKKAYERFLKLVGDSKFAPWVYLRLAEINERKGNHTQAQDLYEMILRNFNQHTVSQDAQVRLFCMYENGLTKNTKKVEYNKVLDKIKNARDILKKQAEACLLISDLDDFQKKSETDKSRNVIEKSFEQKKAIDSYAKKYPNSEFIQLFSDRIKELELSMGTFLASENSCNKLIDFYLKNKKSLNNLNKINHHYVYGLKWDKDDRIKLLRCSAFVKNLSLWKEMRLSDIGKDGGLLQNSFYNMTVKPSLENALLIYLSLKESSKTWVNEVKNVEKSSFELTAQKNFWELLSLYKLINFDLAITDSQKNLFYNAVAQDLFKNPKIIFSSNTFCNWMLRFSQQFTIEEWISIAKIKDKNEWLSLKIDARLQKLQPCESAFANSLFSVSLRHTNSYLDNNILLPFLEKIGLSQGAENWLLYVQRLEKERGIQDPKVKEIYSKLLKESKDSLVKEAAGLWFKKNFPEATDNILW